MADCNNCFHDKVCGKKVMLKVLEPEGFELSCRFFKNKADFAEVKHGLKTAKAEAIKEFAERLKKKAYEGQGFYSVITVSDIDNLVKEMVGE